jgi:hypothetical protein
VVSYAFPLLHLLVDGNMLGGSVSILSSFMVAFDEW